MDIPKKEKSHFTVTGHRRCVNCNRPLKKNLTDKIPNAIYDFVCYNVRVKGREKRYRDKAKRDKHGNMKTPIDLMKKIQENMKKYR